jgi:ABC-2 type transport system permease protein
MAPAGVAAHQRPVSARPVARPPKKTRTAATAPSGTTAADSISAVLWRTGILNVLAIARRDLTALFVSPVGWVVAGLFTFLVSTFGFYMTVIAAQQATMDGVFGVITGFMIPILVPLVTMRLFAEERSQGTLELLLTSPIREWELSVGKWAAAFSFYLLLLATTLVYVVILRIHVGALDLGLIAAAYSGLILAGAAAVAIGALASSLTRNQIIAFVIGMVLLLAVWYAGHRLGSFVVAPANTNIGGYSHLQSFSLGQVAPRDIVYFVTLAAGALFLTTLTLSAKRWR